MNLDPQILAYAPYLIGAAVGVVVLALFWVTGRRTTRPVAAGLSRPGTKSSQWTVSDQSFNDRRSAVRRSGPPTKILVSSPAIKAGVDRGYVLDRSTGGLRVALGLAMPPGSTLQVRAHNAPDTTPWVTVIVRSCRNAGKHFELGCEFDKTPPWNVLLLFG